MPFPVSRNSATPVTLSADELKAIFLNFASTGKNGEKKLRRDQLKAAFEYLGAFMPANEADSALQFVDRNRNGEISEKELGDLVQYTKRFGYR